VKGCRAVRAWVAVVVVATAGCRVATGASDGASDAAGGDRAPADGREAASDVDDAAASPTTAECDLRRQNCPERRACYPDSTFSGATRCVFPGVAGPLAPCLLHEECDVGSICIDINRDGFTVCTPLCDPAASPTGCLPGAPCRRLNNYRAGVCGA
jgi:hypothetical protein